MSYLSTEPEVDTFGVRIWRGITGRDSDLEWAVYERTADYLPQRKPSFLVAVAYEGRLVDFDHVPDREAAEASLLAMAQRWL